MHVGHSHDPCGGLKRACKSFMALASTRPPLLLLLLLLLGMACELTICGFAVWQEMHLFSSALFWMRQVSHSHEPGGGLNFSAKADIVLFEDVVKDSVVVSIEVESVDGTKRVKHCFIPKLTIQCATITMKSIHLIYFSTSKCLPLIHLLFLILDQSLLLWDCRLIGELIKYFTSLRVGKGNNTLQRITRKYVWREREEKKSIDKVQQRET